MSVNSLQNASAKRGPQGATKPAPCAFALHRLRVVRRREGLSRRTVARRLGLAVADVKRQELETTDIPLSVLHRWHKALDVPLMELLQEPKLSLSLPVMKRAQMLRLMKTAKYIMEQAKETPVKRMAESLVTQLIEIMPELQHVASWHLVGPRRRRDEYGRAAEFCLPEEAFLEQED